MCDLSGVSSFSPGKSKTVMCDISGVSSFSPGKLIPRPPSALYTSLYLSFYFYYTFRNGEWKSDWQWEYCDMRPCKDSKEPTLITSTTQPTTTEPTTTTTTTENTTTTVDTTTTKPTTVFDGPGITIF